MLPHVQVSLSTFDNTAVFKGASMLVTIEYKPGFLHDPVNDQAVNDYSE